MRKNILLTTIILSLFTIAAPAQIAKDNKAIELVNEIDGKVVLMKEIKTNREPNSKNAYKILKTWVRKNYGRDHFYSSVRYDEKNNEAIVKSRIELLLPENEKGVREKMVMKFRLNSFIFKDKCVVEILDMAYIHEGDKNSSVKLPRVVEAKDFITDKALKIDDEFKELRKHTKKSTLYFANELINRLESDFAIE